ncbi:hypothetical protein QYF61_020011 [Mycteria americana]|uniref:Uncharacterized protein n=1 Tax=Mycteria americana TaxID=33587 RepID=A0AAN7RUI4_MYCAM|nr:hypothetical protein QYF61_020011 [Mycteria americana]
MAVLGLWLDLMILKVFSNLYDSLHSPGRKQKRLVNNLIKHDVKILNANFSMPEPAIIRGTAAKDNTEMTTVSELPCLQPYLLPASLEELWTPPPLKAAPVRRLGENGKDSTFACDYHFSWRFDFHWKASRAADFKVTGHQVEDFPKKEIKAFSELSDALKEGKSRDHSGSQASARHFQTFSKALTPGRGRIHGQMDLCREALLGFERHGRNCMRSRLLLPITSPRDQVALTYRRKQQSTDKGCGSHADNFTCAQHADNLHWLKAQQPKENLGGKRVKHQSQIWSLNESKKGKISMHKQPELGSSFPEREPEQDNQRGLCRCPVLSPIPLRGVSEQLDGASLPTGAKPQREGSPTRLPLLRRTDGGCLLVPLRQSEPHNYVGHSGAKRGNSHQHRAGGSLPQAEHAPLKRAHPLRRKARHFAELKAGPPELRLSANTQRRDPRSPAQQLLEAFAGAQARLQRAEVLTVYPKNSTGPKSRSVVMLGSQRNLRHPLSMAKFDHVHPGTQQCAACYRNRLSLLILCGGLILAGRQVPTEPLYHSPPQLDRGEKI